MLTLFCKVHSCRKFEKCYHDCTADWYWSGQTAAWACSHKCTASSPPNWSKTHARVLMGFTDPLSVENHDFRLTLIDIPVYLFENTWYTVNGATKFSLILLIITKRAPERRFAANWDKKTAYGTIMILSDRTMTKPLNHRRHRALFTTECSFLRFDIYSTILRNLMVSVMTREEERTI